MTRTLIARLVTLLVPFSLAGALLVALSLMLGRGHVSASQPWYDPPPTPVTAFDPITGLAASNSGPSPAGAASVLTATYNSGAFTAPYSATLRTLDNSSGAGLGTSMVSGSRLFISYYQAITGDLKLARCDDIGCTSTSNGNIDTMGDVGQFSSIAIRQDDILPFFSYYDATNGNLKLAHCADLTCAHVISLTVDITGDVGQYSSLAVGSDFQPPTGTQISYYDVTNHSLKMAICADTECSDITLKTLDSSGDVGQFTSLALDHNYLPTISYYDVTNGDLKLAHCADAACGSVISRTVDSLGDVGRYNALAIGSDGLPIISYYDASGGLLKVAHCGDVTCASAAIHTLDADGDVGQYTSIAIGPDTLPVISYYDATNGDLKLARCNDIGCSSALIVVLDSAGTVGQYTAVGFERDGLPYVSYYDASNGILKMAHATGGVNLAWDFGDGSPLATLVGPPSGAPFSHVYAAAGAYTAVVTATNRNGSWNASTLVTILPAADLRLTLAVTPGVAATGQPVTYTLAYSNAGQLTASGVVITDALPAGFVGVGYASSGAVLTPTAGVTYTWQVADLSPGAGGLITITAQTPSQSATLTNTASIGSASADPNPLNNASHVTLNVLEPVGGLTAANSSPTTLGQATAFTATVLQGTDVSYQWNFDDGQLGSGAALSHTYAAGGSYTAVVTASNGVSLASVTTSVDIHAVGDLRLTQVVTPALASPGQFVTFTIAYTNTGPQPVPGAVISDRVPVGLTQLAYTDSGVAITATGNLSFTWQTQALPPGTGGVITLTGQLSPLLSGSPGLTNTASVTSTVSDTDLGNNSASAAVVLAYPLRVTITGSGSVDSNPVGGACSTDCTGNFVYGTVITLTARASVGGSFAGWSGACSGNDPCQVAMVEAKHVTATFILNLVRIYLPIMQRGP